jgi:DNA-binding MarR family transcriptional regulator
MEILRDESNAIWDGAAKPNINETIALVQGFVQLWIKYEAAMHREVAAIQPPDGDRILSSKLHSYINYGHFYKVSSNIMKYRSPTMSVLSSALSVPFSTATRIVDSMVVDGYVKRLPDPEDRRIVKVALTTRGLQLHDRIEKTTGEHVQKILACLNRDEQAKLFELIGKVMAELEKAT